MTDEVQPALSGAWRQTLIQSANAARSNQSSAVVEDNLGRTWFIAPDIVNNHSTVLLRLTRGQDIRVHNISTAIYSEQAADEAIGSLDAAMRQEQIS